MNFSAFFCLRRKSAGFSLVELLITIALIGIIAGLSIPGLISAIHRGKQKRTMSDLRNMSTAIEEYVIDESYPPFGNGTVDAVLNQPYFTPFYIRNCPTRDQWSFDFHYNENGAFTGSYLDWSYSAYSNGRFGLPDMPASLGEYDVRSFQFDIYISKGQFTCMPGHK